MKGRVRSLLRISGAVLTGLLVAVVVGVFALALAERPTPHGPANIFGHSVMTVLSGSMTPTFRTGDVIVDHLVTPAQARHLHVGQVITFRTGATYQGRPVLITHRIVGVLTVTQKATGAAQHLYTTKGDANNAPDSALVAPAQVVGTYSWRLPYMGYVSAFVHRPLGFALLILLPGLYLIGAEFVRIWRALNEQSHAAGGASAAPPR